jgi:hypothetical protein
MGVCRCIMYLELWMEPELGHMQEVHTRAVFCAEKCAHDSVLENEVVLHKR